MFRKIHNRISPASLLAMVALFVSLGGVSYAAATITSSQIKDNTVKSKDIRNKTIAGKDVRADTLGGTQVDESKLGQVPSAASADQATTAANATSIADNSVSSSKVQDGTLTGKDVGRRAGNTSVTVGSIPANACESKILDVDPANTDLRDDAFAMTVEQTWPTGLVYAPENSDSPGLVRVNVCNVTGGAIDAGVQLFHWVAFDS
jgi:hypothetical protein